MDGIVSSWSSEDYDKKKYVDRPLTGARAGQRWRTAGGHQTASSQLKDGRLAQLGQLVDGAQKTRSRRRRGAARTFRNVAMSMRVPGWVLVLFSTCRVDDQYRLW